MLTDHLKIIKKLGQGGFAEVFLTQNINTYKIYAVKKINENNLSYKEKSYLQNEISILKTINHPNIVKFYGYKKILNFSYIAMEYCNGGPISQNLYEYKRKYGKPFNERMVQKLMKEILLGVKFLHENGIIHRDLKLNNILLKYDNEIDKNNYNIYASHVKIIDFNTSYKFNYSSPQTAVGTVPNMAPSIVQNCLGMHNIYDEKIDIWSLGTLCYEMLFGKPLFDNITDYQIFKNILSSNFIIPNTVSEQARSFLYKMLQKDGKYRFSAKQLLEHEFIKQNNFFFENIINNKINIIKNNLNKEKKIENIKKINFIFNNDKNIMENNICLNNINRNNNINITINNNLKKININQRLKTPERKVSPIRKKYLNKFDRLDDNVNKDKNNKNMKIIKIIFNKLICNGCGNSHFVGYKYKCKVCYNFNYCEKCYLIYRETHHHPFTAEKIYNKIKENHSFRAIPKNPFK